MLEFSKQNLRYNLFLLKYKNLTDKTGVFIRKGSRIFSNTVINNGTRINGKILIKGQGYCKIGKFAALGDEIRIITSNHKTKAVNLQYALSVKIGLNSPIDSKLNVTIGHNVWIGDAVIILPGVVIGNGAVIGAGSVVTKDVQPYSVMGGAPAKLIKFRFSEDRIVEIEKLNWWNWSLEEMQKNKHLLQ